MGIHRLVSSAGLALTLVSAVVVSIARSTSPVRLKVQDIDGVDGLYGTGGAEYFWIAVGAVIGLVGVALIAVAAIAKGLQLGRPRSPLHPVARWEKSRRKVAA